jgi:Mn2+/Fe2+ NRAMP family transporter
VCHHADVSLRARAAPEWRIPGPGFVTGSSDDDPSGIQTHSQTGAQFGYSQLWMAAIAMITLVGSNRAIMGRHVNNWFANLMGWAVVVIMGVCALALIGSLVAGA